MELLRVVVVVVVVVVLLLLLVAGLATCAGGRPRSVVDEFPASSRRQPYPRWTMDSVAHAVQDYLMCIDVKYTKATGIWYLTQKQRVSRQYG